MEKDSQVFSAEEYVEGIPLWAKQKNTVEEVRRFLREELPEAFSRIPVIHVAGTNGKGSVCAYLTRALLDSGLHVGTFISPHLVCVRERILLDGAMVSEEAFDRAVRRVKEASEDFVKRGGIAPSYFEFLFYTAVEVFSGAAPDVVVLETGLGGRLDATNACSPVISVITSISRDHMQYLGNTIPEIAAEKAGIIKPGVPVVYDGNSPEAERVIRDTAVARGSACYRAGTEEEAALYPFLKAPYQRRNAAVAEKAFRVLRELPVFRAPQGEACASADRSLLIPAEQFPESVRRAVWTGRMDEVLPNVILDGGHNEDGMRGMCEGVREILKQRGLRPVLLTGASGDKEAERIVPMVAELLRPERVYAVRFPGSRSQDPEVLAALYRAAGVKQVSCYPSAAEGFSAARREQGERELLVCSGSLYLVGELLKAISAGEDAR